MEVDNKVLDILLQFCCLDFLHEEPRRSCLAKRGHINLPHWRLCWDGCELPSRILTIFCLNKSSIAKYNLLRYSLAFSFGSCTMLLKRIIRSLGSSTLPYNVGRQCDRVNLRGNRTPDPWHTSPFG